MKLVDKQGKEIRSGESIEDFRGEHSTYLYISRNPEPGKTGKIVVDDGFGERELYPSVFEARIVEQGYEQRIKDMYKMFTGKGDGPE